jgi:prepilin-type N-terminal cleavage/methylation domain-containing protein
MRATTSPAARCSRGRGAAGFTLIEILIAMAVLMIGLVGIMAVFPHAMRSATSTVETSYAAAISQSVVDAIRLGLKQLRVETDDAQGFLFVHDGTVDLDGDRQALLRELDLGDPQAVQAAMSTLLTRDYCILLPRPDEEQTGLGGGRVPMMFTYPRKSPADNGGRSATAAVTDGNGDRKWEVGKVYQLGAWLAQHAPNTPEEVQLRNEADPYRRYGYAFTIRPAYGPSALAPSPDPNQHQIVPGLYEVVVKVFRNFSPNPQSPYNEPIAEFVTYVGAR